MQNFEKELIELESDVTKKNWDSYGAAAINKKVIEGVRKFLDSICIVPVADGTMQIEVHSNGIDLEIYFDKNGNVNDIYEKVEEVK
ncbi:hypothetical protein M0R19_08935 [Candidatus Pacearchaeota archaeon]|nr:hypothetical protein [Candidatus Pacearchaeota archaeon]